MPQSHYGTLEIGAKVGEVLDYHRDQQQPGKPLHVLIPGGLIALASLALMIWIAYLTWLAAEIPSSSGLLYLLLLAPAHIGGVFLFSYGYELYDVRKALRLTAIIVFISIAAVIIIAVLFALLGKSKSGSSSKSSSSSGDSDSWSGSGRRWSSGRNWGSLDINIGGDSVVAREIDSPPATPVPCQYCGRPHVPAETGFTCPACGASSRVAL